MRSRMILTVLAVAALWAGTAVGANGTIDLAAGQPRLDLTQEGGDALTFHVEVGQLRTLDVATPEGDFTRLLIPGFHTSMVEGAPELPMMNRLLAIPQGASVRVEVTAAQTRLIELADFGVLHPLMPVQPSLSKSQDPALVPFVYDRAAYQQTTVSQELVRVVEQGTLRAMPLGRLEISPVSYLPGTGQIEVTESFDVTIFFDGADHAAAQDLIARTSSPFFDHLYGVVANDRGFHDDYPDRVGDVVTMVVIVPPQFVGQMQPFVDWKIERGFHMIVGEIGSPEVGTTTTSIQNYIHGLYNDATPEMPAPSFVLFVGDVAQCPTFQLSGNATDRPYCAVDGDLVPDIYYGRFSATNPTQLQAILDKSLMYDQYAMPDPSYLEEVVMIAGMDSGHGSTWGNGQINYGTTYYFNAAHDIFSHTYLYPESGGNAANIIQNVSDGVSYINYTAHGGVTSWSNPSFTQGNINGLQNYGKYCLAVGNCCLTSTYDEPECFAETWLRAPEKGAIGYIGGSNSTYWDEDYWWGVGYTASIVANPTYEQSGVGAYDGVFHDHGEADHLWYVTNDALIFSGNLAVMESGSSATTYYWNIYNLMGDPSISTWIGTPQDNPVTHPETVFLGQESITVGAEYGSYVGLTQDGVLVGAGTVGESGEVTIDYLELLTPGVPMQMVVMAQNRVPYVTDVNVIVPATVLINPMTIDANVTTAITVTVLDADGINPLPGIDVWAEGLEYQTTPVATNASGVAVISVNYPYGPTLDIVGQDPGESYRLFTEAITVNAAPLTAPDLYVTTDIGLADAFALNLPGTLHAVVGQAGATLYAELPDGTLLSTAAAQLTLTPDELGQVTGIIAVSGYDLYSEPFEIIEAFGTLSGTVTSGGTPLANVNVIGWDDAMEVAFDVVTNASGDYTVPEEILVADYTIVVDHFGYLHYEDVVFVNYGENVYDIALTAAPSGVLYGHVYDSGDGTPLQGTVRIYRPDTGELYTEALCDEMGFYETPPLPYFTYDVQARAYHHVPVTVSLTIEEPSMEKNWLLDPTMGDLLLIDDGAKSGERPAKFGGKMGDELLADGFWADDSKSAATLAADLETLGYYVTMFDIDAVDPDSFWDYDVVILACGNNTSTLGNAAVKNGLVSYAQGGGHIMLEGGELGYNHDGDANFATWVMHTNDWNHDSSGNIQIPAGQDHYIVNHPNVISGQIAITYDNYGDSDAMVPLPDAETVSVWTSYPSDASVIAYDTNPSPIGGQIAFFCFNYDAAGGERIDLLENTILWLLTPEFGSATVSGTVTLQGESDHSGISVTAIPNGPTVVTGSDGSYTLAGLFAAPYQIRASKENWSIGSAFVELEEDEYLTGVDIELTPVTTSEFCRQLMPPAPIEDYQTTTDVMAIGTDALITSVEVFLDVTHTYIGDLVVTLSAPCGIDVVLHNRSGGSTYNIHGWYPAELAPAESLDILASYNMQGDWTLTIADEAGGDQGTLNEWCLRIVHGAGGATAVGEMPTVFALHNNYPNPFNPRTNIQFDLPHTAHVSLAVYDVAGRRVRTLVNEVRPAATHTVVWDGNDDGGRRVASGVYYYRLISDEFSDTHKMLLVK